MQNEEKLLTKKERRALRREQRKAARLSASKKISVGQVVFWLILLGIVASTVFAIAKLAGNSAQSPDLDQSLGQDLGSVPLLRESDRVKGAKLAQVVLIEYSDFQCPACASYFPLLTQISEEYKDKVLFVYRHFPLRSIHKNAQLAAQAAEAAHLQGQFWQMHDLLFEKQVVWANQPRPKKTFIEYAASLGLDTEKFESDMESEAVKEKVDQDYIGGSQAGVRATPTFALNGKIIQSPGSAEQFRSILDSAIAEAESETKDAK